MTPWWTRNLPAALCDFEHRGRTASFKAKKVRDVKGEAAVVNVRGTQKFIFDFSFV